MVDGGGVADVREVGEDGTVAWENLSAVGFSLEPVDGGLARYPAHVYLDNSVQPVVVRSAAWQGETPFTKLRVDTAPGHGSKGDRWRLTVRPTALDGEQPRARQDCYGRTMVVPAGATWLFNTGNKDRDCGAWSEMTTTKAHGGLGDFHVTPEAPRAFTRSTVLPVNLPEFPNGYYHRLPPYLTAWDVSRYSRVLVGFELWAPSDLGDAGFALPWRCVPMVSWSSSPAWTPHEEWTMGAVGEFGSANGELNPFVTHYGRNGYLMTGAAEASVGDYTRAVRGCYPFMRFFLRITETNNNVNLALDGLMALQMRFYAYGW
jgi:hypothetical protein